MLCIGRRLEQAVMVGDVEVKVIDIRGSEVVLGFTGPRTTPIHRKERVGKEQVPTPKDELKEIRDLVAGDVIKRGEQWIKVEKVTVPNRKHRVLFLDGKPLTFGASNKVLVRL